ncbi:Ig-like domain-containing protein [Conexibacter sp. JD483]|uniref:Ig-like domain-containing protein n=1 Tax=unclassified Conexibacter TaxID=2627773 RepID=UPI00271EC4C7|nr:MULTISPECIES: Ig-like domain-containing protein [unclassified Conexibacter]MDO8187069.1 Ig-like domain-containing protein [Conexibacter sp. CPCC 205706]MDO8200927.1 Ig-like domain-containing protein [Conexibacter sp. CPCC 205762]MDR9371309.1 Ig-like domain-containing protein [Conexibacter sp. JD483]
MAAFAAIAALPLASASAAQAATLTVDDDRAECPAATYTSVQAAVDAAAAGDTITICPGSYVEGSGAPNTNALTIGKSLTLKGAGADLVSISPRVTAQTGSSIAGTATDIRAGVGSIVSVIGTPTSPLDVAISGITVDGQSPDGRGVASLAGIVYLDAKGSIERSRVTHIVTSEGAEAYNRVGGWRGALPGYGIVQTSATLVGIPGERRLAISNTRVDSYNRAGILIDGASNDSAPFAPSGVTNKGVVRGSQVVGRVECANFEADGNCSNVGLLMTGPLFGQDGIRVTNNSRVEVADSLISQNLVNGAGAPVRPTWDSRNAVYTTQTTDNANLRLAAGIRLLGASLTNYSGANGQTIYSSATRSNITDNAYGVLNLAADGTTDVSGDPTSTGRLGNVFRAERNWWGLGYYRSSNAGPEIAPAANTPFPENPVNGVSTADGTGTTSRSVDFFPYRNGMQGDGFNGQYTVLDAPQAVEDAFPTVALSAPASGLRGTAVTLTADASDDFGVRSVDLFDGATKLTTLSAPPYTASVTLPADAVCGSTRSYTAVATDSLDQPSTSTPVAVAVTCPDDRRGGDNPPPPAPPTVAFENAPRTLSKATKVNFAVTAPAGFASAQLLLGSRTVCTVTKAPFSCTVTPTGADVGSQTLRVVVTDAKGSSAQAAVTVTVPKFATKVTTKVTSKKAKGGKVKRTIRTTVARPKGVTAKQACTGAHVTLVVKRGERTVINQQVRLTGSCTFTRSVTAPRRGGAFRLSAKYSGNAVLRSASTSRRFT